MRSHWQSLAVALGLAAVLTACGRSGTVAISHEPSSTTTSFVPSSTASTSTKVPAPDTFVDVMSRPPDNVEFLEVRSTASGAPLRTLASGFVLLGGNNLLRSRDGSQVVFARYGGQGTISTVATSGGPVTDRTGSFDPALSDDGRYLAWFDADDRGNYGVVVLDPRTGASRTVDVTAILGQDSAVRIGRGLAWLAGGHRLALVAGRATQGGSSAALSPIPTQPAPPTTVPDPMARLAVLDMDEADPRARAIVVAGPSSREWAFVAAGPSPNTVVVFERPPRTGAEVPGGRLITIAVDGANHPQRLLATISAGVEPLDLDPSNTYLLFMGGAELRHATIRDGALVDEVTVPGRFEAASW